MTRRFFASTLAGLPFACRTRVYALETFQVENELMARLATHSGPRMILEAMIGPRLPQILLVHGFEAADLPDKPRLFELRVYRSLVFGGREIEIFRRAGIHPMLHGNGMYLIPFDSLEARGKAWDAVAADPEWGGPPGPQPTASSAFRKPAGRPAADQVVRPTNISVSRIEIYRAVQPGGRILEMSL